MNKEYTYIEGKVIISDENNTKRQAEYTDNLDEVLVQENLIETMEEKIKELDRKAREYKNINRRFFPTILPLSLFMSLVFAPLFVNWLCDFKAFDMIQNTVFGPMSYAMAFGVSFAIFLAPIGAIVDFLLYRNRKNLINEGKGINSELEFLKRQIEKERDTLEELRQEKTRDNESTQFRTVIVDDKQKLQALRNLLDLYFTLGYREEKLYQYYQQGLLEDKLQGCTDTEIALVKEYLKEKGPLLELKKKKSND